MNPNQAEPQAKAAHTPAMEAARIILIGLGGLKRDDERLPDFIREGARIIDRETAAPELLAALKEMVKMMDCGDEPGRGSEWHKKAGAAIAQAEGAK